MGVSLATENLYKHSLRCILLASFFVIYNNLQNKTNALPLRSYQRLHKGHEAPSLIELQAISYPSSFSYHSWSQNLAFFCSFSVRTTIIWSRQIFKLILASNLGISNFITIDIADLFYDTTY